MNPPATSAALVFNIAATERDTGLSKDTLRVWERRYGFPNPKRDASGERLYSSLHIEQLRVLKRLVDAGERPGRLMTLSMPELMERLQRHAPMAVSEAPRALDDCLEILKSHDVEGLRRQLVQARERLGLARLKRRASLRHVARHRQQAASITKTRSHARWGGSRLTNCKSCAASASPSQARVARAVCT